MTAITIDPRLAQRREALLKANLIRARRKELKADLRSGELTAGPLLADPPEWLETMNVRELLMAQRKIGRTKAHWMLRAAQVSPTATVGGLSPRARGELVEILAPRRG